MEFSKDRDLLVFEPDLFGRLGQDRLRLCEGTDGQIVGTSFGTLQADLIAQGVEAGCVLTMDGGAEGLRHYEIAEVPSGDELKVTILRAEDTDDLLAPGDGENLTYRIFSYRAMAREAAYSLAAQFALRPGDAAGQYSVDDVMDIRVFREAAVYAVLAAAFASLASGDDDGFLDKSRFYHKRYQRARRRICVSLDRGADGVEEQKRYGNSFRLERG